MIIIWYWYDWMDILNINILWRDPNNWGLVIFDISLFWLYFQIRYDSE